MIHLSYAIAQFFEIMLRAILRAVGGALVIGLLALVCAAAIVIVVRKMRRRRRKG